MTERTYTVVSGDSLSSIAKKVDMTVDALRQANPQIKGDLIRPGDVLFLGNDRKMHKIRRIDFDGRRLVFRFESDARKPIEFKAISGLPPGSNHVNQLIRGGRRDLDPQVDYRRPRHQNVRDAGPIPTGSYYLRLSADMPYEYTGGGWGAGAWRLREGLIGRFDDLFGGRNGFFLHEDGGSPGTAGCIGIIGAGNFLKIKTLLVQAHDSSGQREVEILVRY